VKNSAGIDPSAGRKGSLKHILNVVFDHLDPRDAILLVGHQAAVFKLPVGEGLGHFDAQIEIADEAINQPAERFVELPIEPVRMEFGGYGRDVLGELALRFGGDGKCRSCRLLVDVQSMRMVLVFMAPLTLK
jgi:hypothetical protein